MSLLKMSAYGVASFAALISGNAFAGTSTGSLPVSVIILENCTVAATPMTFAATSNVGTAAIDSSATISLTCTPNADFDVALNGGSNGVSGVRNMKLSAGTELLPYEIYQDAARTQVWGNTAGVNTVAGTAPSGASTMTAYGRIAATTPAASAGAYSDTVTVTVTF